MHSPQAVKGQDRAGHDSVYRERSFLQDFQDSARHPRGGHETTTKGVVPMLPTPNWPTNWPTNCPTNCSKKCTHLDHGVVVRQGVKLVVEHRLRKKRKHENTNTLKKVKKRPLSSRSSAVARRFSAVSVLSTTSTQKSAKSAHSKAKSAPCR
jgi:hypothetical protein